MPVIEIDFDVFKALTIRRPSELVSENDVLRELLGLDKGIVKRPEPVARQHWMTKGVSFPIGTRFRAKYKGKEYVGLVEEGGLRLGEKKFVSPSSAAASITGSPVNGWTFWECQFPGQSAWKSINTIRELTN